MAQKLIVRLLQPGIADLPDATAEKPLMEWALYQTGDLSRLGGGQVASFDEIQQTLLQNGYQSQDLQLIGVVPGEEVTICRGEVPVRQARQVAEAMPYAIEEQIAEDIEAVHVAVGGRNAQGSYPVVAVRSDLMADWLAFFSGQGMVLEAILVDSLLIPATPEQWSMLVIDGVAHLNVSGQQAFAFAPENLLTLLECWDQEANGRLDDVDLKVLVEAESMEQTKLQVAQAEQLYGMTSSFHEVSTPVVDLLVPAALDKSRINLLQGAYKGSGSAIGSVKGWMAVAAVVVVWFVAQIVFDLSASWYYNEHAQNFRAASERIYRDIFPETQTIRSVRKQMEGHLNAGADGSAGGFVSLVSAAGEGLAKQADRKAISFNSLGYNSQRGELIIELQANSFDALDTYKQSLAEAGYAVEINSAIYDENRVKGRISVRGS